MKQEVTEKERTQVAFQVKVFFFSENFPESGIYLTNKMSREGRLPLCVDSTSILLCGCKA